MYERTGKSYTQEGVFIPGVRDDETGLHPGRQAPTGDGSSLLWIPLRHDKSFFFGIPFVFARRSRTPVPLHAVSSSSLTFLCAAGARQPQRCRYRASRSQHAFQGERVCPSMANGEKLFAVWSLTLLWCG